VNVTLIRHATLLLETSRGRVLVDPMLRAAGTTPPIENTPNPRSNPLVELPLPAEDVVREVDLCVVTHLHADHFDERARELVPADLPILTMPEHAQRLEEQGFTQVRTECPGFSLTSGRHGSGPVGEAMGAVCGFVVEDVYVAGDTILCDEVRDGLETHRPRAVIVNAGGAQFIGSAPIVMNSDDVHAPRGNPRDPRCRPPGSDQPLHRAARALRGDRRRPRTRGRRDVRPLAAVSQDKRQRYESLRQVKLSAA
jgi:L-ascorbate metabolism protein UlaG (beta-lactamase superfamily)